MHDEIKIIIINNHKTSTRVLFRGTCMEERSRHIIYYQWL